MRVTIRRNRGNRSCFCIKRKIEKRRKQWFELGVENLEKLKAKDKNLQKQLTLHNTLCKIHFLSKSRFRKQFLKMCPEEGLCSHVLPLNPSNNGEGSRVQDGRIEELVRPEGQSGSRAVHSDHLGGHDLNGHANNQPTPEENTSSAGVGETTHTPVDDDPESDEIITSILDYFHNL
ncbi:hypothetical protein EB796_000177 [Bugula neritina]|uniref:Uncharacterized protein n=1 Tax=Bugula neritina TaxID=10212 RepID=A0A7J7KTK6_BUGNE|nr:hypothetical protein EB796_000177 [Bugula neritina]